MSQTAEDSQTAQDFISSQLQLEAEAREALPYQFDTCTRPLGPLRQSLFACLTCNPPPDHQSDDTAYAPAAVCYSCSISCHGEHNLVELFSKRHFVCDCGTTRLPTSAPCTLRLNPTTNQTGGVSGEIPAADNKYNHNFAGRFCACEDDYDPTKEKGTMFQCLGLGNAQDGGCGEDWWHPECLMGLPRQSDPPSTANANAAEAPQDHEETPLPPGFPQEDDFDHLICYKCVDANPWIKQYASTPGFLAPIFHKHVKIPQDNAEQQDTISLPLSPSNVTKRKAEDDAEASEPISAVKKVKFDDEEEKSLDPAPAEVSAAESDPPPKHASLPPAPQGSFSLFLNEDFRDHFCHCPQCFPVLAKYPQLLEEEDAYEPPVSESDDAEANGRASVGSGSTYERGEALLSNMDRVKAIEGVMVYNQLRDKVKAFLQPFAESGQAVGAEDIKAYFAKLRGDDEDIRRAAAGAGEPDADAGNDTK